MTPVNLNKARKARARAAAAQAAAENRARFGRTKGERARDAAEALRRDQAHAGARLDETALDRAKPGKD